MKQLFLITILFSLLVSCKKHKEEFHKIKYQIEFYEIPDKFGSNYTEVTALPSYQGEYSNSVDANLKPIAPYINYEQTTDGLWEYEYWELKKGDRVIFDFYAFKDYHFKLSVFIDGTLYSSKRVKLNSEGTNEVIDLESYGLDDTPDDYRITFNYY